MFLAKSSSNQGSSSTVLCGASIGLGTRIGNSTYASRVAHIFLAASAAAADLVLFLLIGEVMLSSLIDLFLLLCGVFFCGDGTSGFTAEVEGIFSCSSGYSSSVKVPPHHSGEDSMVTSSIFSSISLALSPSGSIVAAFSATPISPSADKATLLFGSSTGFLSTSSLNCSVFAPG